MIGDDETMARQVGINVPFAKVTIFVVSAVFMTLTGAVMAPRFGFINPNFAFNPADLVRGRHHGASSAACSGCGGRCSASCR